MTAILHSNLETDLRLAAALDKEISMLLADRASLRNTGTIRNYGMVNGMGSDTKVVRLAGLAGTNAFSATAAENTDVSTTALTDSSVSIAVARAALRRDISDLADLTGFQGSDITPETLAAAMVIESEAYFVAQVATAVATASTNVGSSGVDFSVDNWFDALFTLELNNNEGPFTALLHPQQLADLQDSLIAEAGAMQFMPAYAELLQVKGQGYSGQFLGVDIYKSSRVTEAGGNKEGGMWGAGAIGFAEGTPNIAYGDVVRPAASPLVVEFDRLASSATTSVVGHYYLGVAVIEQSRLVGIVTDA